MREAVVNIGPPYGITIDPIIADPFYLCMFSATFSYNGKKKTYRKIYITRNPDDITTFRNKEIDELKHGLKGHGIVTTS